jgi:outer membrane receptor protein involved in Fe transport
VSVATRIATSAAPRSATGPFAAALGELPLAWPLERAANQKGVFVGSTKFCWLLILSLFAALTAQAAILNTVRGVVHDPQHRPVPSAQLQLESRTSDFTQTTQTNQEGEFTFTAIPIGDYDVTVTAAGFAQSVQQITVVADSSPVLHFMLDIASVRQTATVSASTSESAVESATPSTLVDRKDIALTPGASLTNSLAMITDYVPAAYITHDMLHIRGGHQVSWLIDGVSIPNTNIASNVAPQFDPKDIDYLQVLRGSYEAQYGDRTFGEFEVVPRSGFERNSEGELVATFGSFDQTNEYLSFGSHTERFAYYVSLNGNRSNLGLETPVPQVYHDAENGFGGFTSLIYNLTPQDQLRFEGSARRDYYQIPYDPNPNDAENQQFNSSGLRDAQSEKDTFGILSWVHTINTSAVLTVSPFFHYNSADYNSSPRDTPIATTDDLTSNYGGGQAVLAFHLPKNEAQAGVYAFGQRDTELFGLLFNDGSGNPPIRDAESPTGSLAALFLDDKITVTPWLTLSGGVRYTHYDGGVSESATDPRVSGSLRIPHLKWVFHAFYGRFYQLPPLTAISGPLLGFINNMSDVSFTPLRGERDEEHQFGVTIPIYGWSFDVDDFETGSRNFLDHNNIGESDIFIPVTVAGARIRGLEATLRSPRIWNRASVHLAYSNQMAQGEGAFTGGLIVGAPPPPGFFALDHDQRNTLNVGFDASLPWRTFLSSNVYYGSGFSNGTPPPNYLPGHTTVDLSAGKDFGERFSIAVNALNVGDSHLLIDNSLTFGGFHFNNPREVYGEFRYRFRY